MRMIARTSESLATDSTLELQKKMPSPGHNTLTLTWTSPRSNGNSQTKSDAVCWLIVLFLFTHCIFYYLSQIFIVIWGLALNLSAGTSHFVTVLFWPHELVLSPTFQALETGGSGGVDLLVAYPCTGSLCHMLLSSIAQSDVGGLILSWAFPLFSPCFEQIGDLKYSFMLLLFFNWRVFCLCATFHVCFFS